MGNHSTDCKATFKLESNTTLEHQHLKSRQIFDWTLEGPPTATTQVISVIEFDV